MAMNRTAVFSIVLVASLLSTPAIAFAQSFDSSGVVNFIWVKTFGFQPQWLNEPRELILQAILPTIAIYAVFLGLVRTLQIFGGMGNLEHVIAAVVTFSGLLLGWIGWVSAALAFLGVWSFLIFFVLFFVGSILYSMSFFSKYRKTPGQELDATYKRSIKYLRGQLEHTRGKLVVYQSDAIKDPEKYAKGTTYYTRLATLIAMEKKIERQIAEVNEKYKASQA